MFFFVWVEGGYRSHQALPRYIIDWYHKGGCFLIIIFFKNGLFIATALCTKRHGSLRWLHSMRPLVFTGLMILSQGKLLTYRGVFKDALLRDWGKEVSSAPRLDWAASHWKTWLQPGAWPANDNTHHLPWWDHWKKKKDSFLFLKLILPVWLSLSLSSVSISL